MITNDGKDVIKLFFGSQIGQIADTLAFGTGTTAASAADGALEAEVVRVTVTSVRADLANSRIIFKAVLTRGSIDTIHEVGLINSSAGKMVARTVLDTPKVTDVDLPTEIEYSLKVTV